MSNTTPEGWERKLLKETISTIIAGQSPNRKDHAAKAGKYGILKTTAIDWGKYSPDKNQEVLDDFKVNPKQEVKADDILITKAGPIHRVGVVTYVPETPEKILVSGKMTLLRTGSAHDSRFVSYALSTEYSQKPLKESTTGMASSQTNFTHDTLLDIPLWVPNSLLEQQKIAAILSSVDDVIEKTRAMIDKLKDLKTGMMQEILTKGIGHTEFKNSHVGKIPKGWNVLDLGKLATQVKPGPFGSSLTKAMYVNDGYKVYGQEQVISGNFEVGDYFIDQAKYDELSAFKVAAGDILISLVGTFGQVAVVPQDFHPGIINPRLLKMRFSSGEVDSEFIAQQLRSEFVLNQLKQLQQGGTMGVLSATTVKPVKLIVPPLNEQKLIGSSAHSIDRLCSKKRLILQSTQNLKRSLMQDLLTGKIRVNIENHQEERMAV